MKMNSFILTNNGHHFDYINLDNNVLDIEDIAHALANICRFAGHCKEYYSVAQHSVLVANLVPSIHYKAALFHDAAEAYLNDIPSPLKVLLPDYKEITKKVEAWLQQVLEINIYAPEIKQADLQLLAAEKRDLMLPNTQEWLCLKVLVYQMKLLNL